MSENKKRNIVLIVITLLVAILGGFGFYNVNKDKSTEEIVSSAVNEIKDYITTYNMTQEEIEELPSTEIKEQTLEDEQKLEQEVESESFELQGEVAYEGTTEYPQVSIGDYTGLTYYSQIDSRWSNKMYSSTGNASQTIGTSGCGPTSAAMIVTATKGTITPDEMADLFVQYGYRSANNGTYLSAFRFVADTFNIEYQETYKLDDAVSLLRDNNYLVVSVNNGLFTTGGHLMCIVGIEGDMLKIYDPYLYAGKFETSTRRGKVTVGGNTVYCSIDNFRNYANYTKFFAYKHDGNVQENTKPVITSTYTRYVNTNRLNLNVRNAPNGSVIGSLKKGTQVTVAETNGSWSRITSPVSGWVSSSYLAINNATSINSSSSTKYITGRYKVTRVSKNSVLYVRTGPGTNYSKKIYRQLSTNARSQNRANGNYYANGYKNNVVFTVSKISGNWGLTPSGWVCLDYCTKI